MFVFCFSIKAFKYSFKSVSSFGQSLCRSVEVCIHTHTHTHTEASLVTQLVKNPPAAQESWFQSLDWEDPLEKGKATHSSILA